MEGTCYELELLEVVLYVLNVPEAVEGVLCLLEVPEVMRCVPLCMLEATEAVFCLLRFILLEKPEVMRYTTLHTRGHRERIVCAGWRALCASLHAGSLLCRSGA